jgi:hypothetical protein
MLPIRLPMRLARSKRPRCATPIDAVENQDAKRPDLLDTVLAWSLAYIIASIHPTKPRIFHWLANMQISFWISS